MPARAALPDAIRWSTLFLDSSAQGGWNCTDFRPRRRQNRTYGQGVSDRAELWQGDSSVGASRRPRTLMRATAPRTGAARRFYGMGSGSFGLADRRQGV